MRGIFLVVDAGETESRLSWAEKEILFGFDCIVAPTCFSQCPTLIWLLELENAVQVNSLPSNKRTVLTKVQMSP